VLPFYLFLIVKIDGVIVKQQYGFIKAKMIRCKLLHLFLWCHTFGKENDEFMGRMKEDEVEQLLVTDAKEGKRNCIQLT
jgi:hypothetical protein